MVNSKDPVLPQQRTIPEVLDTTAVFWYKYSCVGIRHNSVIITELKWDRNDKLNKQTV